MIERGVHTEHHRAWCVAPGVCHEFGGGHRGWYEQAWNASGAKEDTDAPGYLDHPEDRPIITQEFAEEAIGVARDQGEVTEPRFGFFQLEAPEEPDPDEAGLLPAFLENLEELRRNLQEE